MQKKCKKMQIYLHIWKIFCTFASDLGIVPSATIRYHRVMKKECIWKCQTGKIVLKVLKMSDFRFALGFSYRVYLGRKWWNHCAYEKYEDAIRAAIYVSLMGNFEVTITKKL